MRLEAQPLTPHPRDILRAPRHHHNAMAALHQPRQRMSPQNTGCPNNKYPHSIPSCLLLLILLRLHHQPATDL